MAFPYPRFLGAVTLFVPDKYLLAEITECLSIFVGPSIVQSLTFFFSNLQSLQIQSITSLYLSFLAVTLYTSFPCIQTVVLPVHLVHSLCASIGLTNQTRLLK